MSNKELFRYDAFISYRHAELDSFVAETVHRELEKFKLPKKLASKRGTGEKSKIERVFRDKEELPISADLSENISAALNQSDFLIVICTPRLKESIWCKSEIDQFVNLRGRDKVLVVLAEGEPWESFPEQLTQDSEPLAADVRGKSRSEIRKKIKEEVMRLAAAMFECNYDEIRQRHREQILRRRVVIASTIAAAGLIFAGTVSVLALQINSQKQTIIEQYAQIEEQCSQIEDQYTQIENQYAQIEDQYRQTLIKQSEVVVSQAKSYLEDGDFDSAKSIIVDAYKDAGDKLPDEACDNFKYMLAEVLNCYNDGSFIYPVGNLAMDNDAGITSLCASSSYDYVAGISLGKSIAIWNLNDFSKVCEIETLDTLSVQGQDYGFDSEDNFYFINGDVVTKYDCHAGETAWETTIANAGAFVGIGEDRMLVMAGDTAHLVNRKTGDIELSSAIEGLSSYSGVNRLIVSSKRDKVLAVAMGNSAVGGYLLFNINVDDLSVDSTQSIKGDVLLSAVNTGKGHYFVEVGVHSKEQYWEYDYTLASIDENSLKVNWTKSVTDNFTDMYMLDGSVLCVCAGGLSILDADNGSVIKNCPVDRRITDIVLLPDGRLKLLLTDATQKVQNADEFSFYESAGNDLTLKNVTDYKYAGKYQIAIPFNGNKATIYTKAVTDGAKEIEISEEDLQKSVVYDFASGENNDTGYYDAAHDITITQDGDYSTYIYGSDKENPVLSLKLTSSAVVRSVNEDYIAVGDNFNSFYIINVNTLRTEARVYGYIDYDAADNTFIIAKDIYGNTAYKVPFLSLEELLA